MERPVEVVARIRNDQLDSCIQADEASGKSVRVQVSGLDGKSRVFELDGVCSDGDLGGFYGKYFKERVGEVRLGGKATFLMYGPTGTGKTHTMFGCEGERGVIYNALEQLLERTKLEVRVSIFEVYNEEVYDLLSVPKAKLDIRSGKVQSARTITSGCASYISNQIETVEKTRVMRNTNCNERSSRSHCIVMLDVEPVDGCLMLVDMAGSENVEGAGLSAADHFQSGKINQGNGALKRVIDAISNNDAYVPYRDSKLTMLLQDSFKVAKSKIMMVLCVNPDPRDFHKTVSTLEYGAKAKSIVRMTTIKATKAAQSNDARKVEMLKAEVLRLEQEQELASNRISSLEEENLKLKEQSSLFEAEKRDLELQRGGEILKLAKRLADVEAEKSELLLELQRGQAVLNHEGSSCETGSEASNEHHVSDDRDSSDVDESSRFLEELRLEVPPPSTEADVLVKWESGDFVAIITMHKYVSLAELRQAIVPRVAYLKRNFKLLMLGDRGCPLETSEEINYRVISLPSCKDTGKILAVLRPPVIRTVAPIVRLKPEDTSEQKKEKKAAPRKKISTEREKVSLRDRTSRAYSDLLLKKMYG